MVVGGWPYRLLIGAATVFGGFEYIRLLHRLGYEAWFPWSALLILASEFDIAGGTEHSTFPFVTLSVLIVSLWTLLRARESSGQRGLTELWALVIAGGLYLGLGGGHLIALRFEPGGLAWLLVACGVVWIGDSAAYLVGTHCGRHKMAPTISPGKSWEGYAAQVLSGCLSGPLLAWIGLRISGGTSLMEVWHGLVLGITVSVLSPAGDFFISMMKREVGVKDTGRLIPGHGGILDRMDSILWAGILGHLLAQLLS